jgi:hypothetical protein
VPDSIAGLPLHPLVVHVTVVIVPTAALTVFLAAVWPRFREWAGLLPLGLAVTGLILDPLSTSSGESLEHQVGQDALIEKHSELADGLLPWMDDPPRRDGRGPLRLVLAQAATRLRRRGKSTHLGAGRDLGAGGGGRRWYDGSGGPDRPQRRQGRVVGRQRAVHKLASGRSVVRRIRLPMLA